MYSWPTCSIISLNSQVNTMYLWALILMTSSIKIVASRTHQLIILSYLWQVGIWR
jgi:hypothetical protein